MTQQQPLEYYLGLDYPFNVIAAEEGGFVIVFPDLPGCFTQVEAIDEVSPMADEIRILWIEGEYEDGHDIPLPTYPAPYSGKFNVRVPKSLHRDLVVSAEREGASLNQYVVALLARGDAEVRAGLQRPEEDAGEPEAETTAPEPVASTA